METTRHKCNHHKPTQRIAKNYVMDLYNYAVTLDEQLN